MPKSRISSHQRPSSASEQSKIKRTRLKNKKIQFVRFAGVSLAGGKTAKTCVAVVDYFPNQEKVFLHQLIEKVGGDTHLSADEQLKEILEELTGAKDLIAVDAPLSLPSCIGCRLKCPGVQECRVKEVVWMRKQHEKRDSKKKKPNKPFTPYTERCADIYIQEELEEPFVVSHALGANAAPLTARIHFLKKRVQRQFIEVSPKTSVWRIGRSLRVAKSHLRFHKHSVSGEESREVFLKAMGQKEKVFIYQQDLKSMVLNNSCFEAFISAFTAYLKFRGECEKRPRGFPAKSSWIEFPKKVISW